MKKYILIILSVFVLVIAAGCGYQVYAHETILRQNEYDAGFDDGIEWAMENMKIYSCERYDPDNPEETLREDGYDQTVYIDLGGLTYEHGLAIY